jgi:hypothetical protein
VTKEYVIFVLALLPIHHISYSQWTALSLVHSKTYYNSYVNDWILSNLGRLVIIYSVADIIGISFSKAFTEQNIEKRFYVTDFVL